MRRSLAFALGAALVALAAPVSAHAADIATLSCVTDTASAEARADVGQYVRGSFNHEASPPDLLVKLTQTAKACAKDHGWSETAAKAASAYGMVIIGLPVAAEELRKRDVDPDRISALFDEMPAEIREKMPSGDMPPEFAAIMQKALDEGLLHDGEAREAVSQYMALLFVRDFSRATFLRS